MPELLQMPSISSALPAAKSWAVAWTVSHGERQLVEYLKSLDVPSFFPLVNKRRAYKSGIKNWAVPLFSGYVFFDGESVSRSRVFESRKVAEILSPPEPELLRTELSQLALALDHDSELRETRFGEPGRPVYVARGPMKGLLGKLIRIGTRNRLVISISFLSKAVELAIDEAYIEPA